MDCSLKQQILQFDRQVPRYTSYPTAPHFQPCGDDLVYKAWLSDISAYEELSLYVHVPFCQKLCWYCGCHTKITKRYAPIEDYVHLMLREIDILAASLPHDYKVKNLHFGGGSPGLLRACDFDLIMCKIKEHFTFSDAPEISIEIDPRNVSEGRVATYAKHGVNRVSLGVQDFNETVLKAVNRAQPFHLSYEAIKLFRSYGIDQVNLDIMYGLPHQTTQSIRTTVETALLLQPSRIAFFGYAHVPWMKKHMRLIEEGALPDKDMRFDLFETGAQILKQNGFVAVGIDHFARPDDPLAIAAHEKNLHRNFQGYTTDSANTLLGIGVSSIGNGKNGFVQNTPHMPAYKEAVLSGNLPVAKMCVTTVEDHMRGEIIESLMCNFEVNLQHICDQYDFDAAAFNAVLSDLEMYQKLGFVEELSMQCVRVNPEARMMARIIASYFDAYLGAPKDAPQYSKAI